MRAAETAAPLPAPLIAHLLRAELLDQHVELRHFFFGQIGQRCAHRTCAVADQLRAGLHDTHRITLAAVADRQIRQEELIDQLADGRMIIRGNRAIETPSPSSE